MIETRKNIMALDHVGVVKVFQDGDLMVEQSLGSFAFDGLILNELDGNGLLIEFVNTQVNVAETALADWVGPLEEILLYFFDCVLTLTTLGNHVSVLLVHAWLDYSLNLALILI